MRVREDRTVRVLIVEDELRMASLIRRGLVNDVLAADVAGSGEDTAATPPSRAPRRAAPMPGFPCRSCARPPPRQP